jgi:hypothetical protein
MRIGSIDGAGRKLRRQRTEPSWMPQPTNARICIVALEEMSQKGGIPTLHYECQKVCNRARSESSEFRSGGSYPLS